MTQERAVALQEDQIMESKTADLLVTHGLDDVNREWYSFSRMVFVI